MNSIFPYCPSEDTFQPFVCTTLQGIWCEKKITCHGHAVPQPCLVPHSCPDLFQVLVQGIYQCTPAYCRHSWIVHHMRPIFVCHIWLVCLACIVWRDSSYEMDPDIHPQWYGGLDCKESVIAGCTCPIYPVLLRVCHTLNGPVVFLFHQSVWKRRNHGMYLEIWWLEILTFQCQHFKGLLLLLLLTCTLLPKWATNVGLQVSHIKVRHTPL